MREIYLVGVNNVSFFKNAVAGAIYGVPQCADITVKLGVDGDDSENDLESYAAMTAITGQLSYQPSGLIRVFQDLESLPASVYIKVFGSDKAGAEILYIRETTVPHMVGQSILKGLTRSKSASRCWKPTSPTRPGRCSRPALSPPRPTWPKQRTTLFLPSPRLLNNRLCPGYLA